MTQQDRNSGAPDEGRRQLLTWLWRLPVVAVLAGAGYALFEVRRVLFGKAPAIPEPSFEPRDAVEVGTVDQFSDTWDSVSFDLHGVPAVAVRTPEPVPGGLSSGALHLAAFSRVCTHQGCLVSLNRDLEAIAFGFNHRTDTPELVCPCHLSVFSPSAAGRAVSGPATQPLPRVQLRLDAGRVTATGIESGSATTG